MILFQLLFQTLQDPVDKLAKKKGKIKSRQKQKKQRKKKPQTTSERQEISIVMQENQTRTKNSENVEYMYGQCSVWTETKNFCKPAVGQPDSSPRHQLRLFS